MATQTPLGSGGLILMIAGMSIVILGLNWLFVRSAMQGACPPCNCPALPECDVYSEPPHLPGYIYTN